MGERTQIQDQWITPSSFNVMKIIVNMSKKPKA